MKHHLLPVSPRNVQWGYFSRKIAPALTLKSGDATAVLRVSAHVFDKFKAALGEHKVTITEGK